MIGQDNQLRRLDGLTASVQNRQRMPVMEEPGLLQSESTPIFAEATQKTAQALDVPICILGIIQAEQLCIQSAVGLSRLRDAKELAANRQLSCLEPFCGYVVDNRQTLAIADTLAHSAFANSSLVNQYGIRAYLGVPLITFDSYCLGTLAIMDVAPRRFTPQDVEFLQLMARWSMSEVERQRSIVKTVSPPPPTVANHVSSTDPAIAHQLRVDLLNQLTQELRTPLTSVMGMASVLTHEVYGPLTNKQKEYLSIIHTSGHYLLSLVNEIVELSELKGAAGLNLTSVDIEMLCRQAIHTLGQAVQRRQQQIRLTVEPGRRVWLVDKEKVRQIIYHLVFGVIQGSTVGSIIRLHISQRERNLALSIWDSHPWLGEELPFADISSPSSLKAIGSQGQGEKSLGNQQQPVVEKNGAESIPSIEGGVVHSAIQGSRKNLGLLLSQHLAELHGGKITVQGKAESGDRYVVTLPQFNESGRNL
ncbi:MAG: HAMP domain-containing histidine kinase [Leptolyngbyaceae cyanobacterium RU_5_1]|nr:HAMP domain-containing histidine kinase [Leptolyngbyaceae cyanobacterium RU_5_1]